MGGFKFFLYDIRKDIQKMSTKIIPYHLILLLEQICERVYLLTALQSHPLSTIN